MVRLISSSDETNCRTEVSHPSTDKNLSMEAEKTKDIVVELLRSTRPAVSFDHLNVELLVRFNRTKKFWALFTGSC